VREELPKGWKEIDLDKIVIYGKGKKPKKLSAKNGTGMVPYVNIKAFEQGIIDEYADVHSSKLIDENDILVVWDGARFGLTGMGMKGAAGSTLMVITPIINYPKYIYSFINRHYSYINSKPKGTGTPHVNPDIFWNLQIPIAPINEQKRITAKLNQIMPKIDGVKERLERIPQIIKRFRQSVLYAAVTGKLTEKWREEHPDVKPQNIYTSNSIEFSKNLPEKWKITKAKRLCSKITDGEHQTPKRLKRGEMLLSAKNVRDGYIDYKSHDYISKYDFERCLKRCNPEPGDVLIVSVGATIGRCAIVEENQSFALVRSVGLFKPNNLIYGKFLLYTLQSFLLQKIIEKESQGSAQPCFYINKMENLPIVVPPFEEQKEIVRQVDKLFSFADKLEDHYKKAKEKVDKFPQSVLAKAFRGELVPQDPDDEPAEKLLERIKEEKARLESELKKAKRKVSRERSK
jgi:type I restriction enzyme S subunit